MKLNLLPKKRLNMQMTNSGETDQLRLPFLASYRQLSDRKGLLLFPPYLALKVKSNESCKLSKTRGCFTILARLRRRPEQLSLNFTLISVTTMPRFFRSQKILYFSSACNVYEYFVLRPLTAMYIYLPRPRLYCIATKKQTK